MSKLRFSVVIPCFNEEACLGETLRTLNEQDFKGGYEVIVVDNNCTDGTVRIAQQYGARVITELSPGVCYARQAGTDAAQGEIVVSSDADTTFDPDWLTQIDRKFGEHPGAVGVCGPCDFVAAPWWARIYPKVLFGGVRFVYLLSKRPVYITATNTAFLKEAFDGYDTNMTQGGDELYVLHSLRRKGRVCFTLDYSVHTSSRRLDHGLWYNVFVSFSYYYFIAYHVNKMFGRAVIGMAPAYRELSMSQRAREQFSKMNKKIRTVDINKTIRATAMAAPAAVRRMTGRVEK